MKDPDKLHDTEPIEPPMPSVDDTEPGVDPVDSTDALLDGLGKTSADGDTDDFLRWLPTMSLGHRRRKELVERSSSDGADFAAYACEGRPAVSAAPGHAEGQVQVEGPPAAASSSRGGRMALGERDALTMIRARPDGRSRRAFVAGAAAGLVTAGLAVAGWAVGPFSAGARPPGASSARARPVSSEVPLATAPSGSVALAPVAGSPSVAPTSDANQTVAAASPSASRSTSVQDAIGGRVPVAAQAERGAGARVHTLRPVGRPSTVPAKDAYFEAP